MSNLEYDIQKIFDGGSIGGGIIDTTKMFMFGTRTRMIISVSLIFVVVAIIIWNIAKKETYIGPTIYDSTALYSQHGYEYPGFDRDISWNDEFRKQQARQKKKKRSYQQ